MLLLRFRPNNSFQGFTKEFIELKQDYIGVNYTGLFNIKLKWSEKISCIIKMTSGKKDLLEYEIQEWEVFVHDSGDMSVAEVKIVFRR